MADMDKEGLTEDLRDVANKRRKDVMQQRISEIVKDIQAGEYDE